MKKNIEFSLKRFIIDVLTDVVVVFVLVQVIRLYFRPFRVHGPSMCDTLMFTMMNVITEMASIFCFKIFC